jgi:hypothetical protein
MIGSGGIYLDANHLEQQSKRILIFNPAEGRFTGCEAGGR